MLRSTMSRLLLPCKRVLTGPPEQSRRCPLCNQEVGSYLIHNIRNRYDYQKYYLPELRKPIEASLPSENRQIVARARANRQAVARREWGRAQQREREEKDALERAIDKRRFIYTHDLYAKVGSCSPTSICSCMTHCDPRS